MPTIRATRATTSGALAKASATLVSGPSVASVTVPGGSRRSVSTMKSTAWASRAATAGSGRSGPSSPDLPCTASAVTELPDQRPAAPACTATSGRPASSTTFSAFFVVRGSGTLPATVVMPSTSISGLASASRIATASSCPGSVSMMMRWVTLRSARRPPGPVPRGGSRPGWRRGAPPAGRGGRAGQGTCVSRSACAALPRRGPPPNHAGGRKGSGACAQASGRLELAAHQLLVVAGDRPVSAPTSKL